MPRTQRVIFFGIFLTCVALLAFALYLQEVKHLLPCPLCVVQRIAYWLVGLTALLAFLHNPKRLGRRLYSGLLFMFALAGAAVALYHAWLIRNPHPVGCRASPEEAFLNALPLAQWWPGMFAANGDCALVTWEWLSLTIPDWSLLCFFLLVGVSGYLLVSRKE